jgi:large subunit ribosomal protein L10
VEAAKSLRDFSKAHNALVLRGGLLAGRFVDAAEVAKLADLESREVLLAKLAGAMKASMSQAASLFAAPLSQTARAVEALRAKVEDGAPAAPEPAAETDAGESEAASSAGSLRSTPSDTTSDSADASVEDAAAAPADAADPAAETTDN